MSVSPCSAPRLVPGAGDNHSRLSRCSNEAGESVRFCSDQEYARPKLWFRERFVNN